MTAKFILKKRDLGEKKPRAFGGIVQTYYKWVSVGKYETLADAGEAIPNNGLVDFGVFFKGKRLSEDEIWKAMHLKHKRNYE